MIMDAVNSCPAKLLESALTMVGGGLQIITRWCAFFSSHPGA